VRESTPDAPGSVGAGADAAIGALVVGYGRSLFGWQEVGFRTPIELAVLTELGAAIVLAAALTGTAVLAVARSR
jgi:hypothetical protein